MAEQYQPVTSDYANIHAPLARLLSPGSALLSTAWRPTIALETSSIVSNAQEKGGLEAVSSATEERIFKHVIGLRRAEKYIAAYEGQIYASSKERRQVKIITSSLSKVIRRNLEVVNGTLKNASSEERERLKGTISVAEGYISAHNKQSPVEITL